MSETLAGKLQRQNIAILADSQAVIKALKSNRVNSRLLERLNTLGSQNKVWILWVAAHIGLEGDDAAEGLTKKGIGTPLLEPEPSVESEVGSWL